MTLVEMLIGMLILMTVLASAFRLFEIYYIQYLLADARAETQQSGRAAIEILSREIRAAGQGVPRNRPCHIWSLDDIPVTVTADTIRMLLNVKSIHTRLLQPAAKGATVIQVPTQSDIDASGRDWSPGSDFEKNKSVYFIDVKDPSVASDDHVECFHLAAAGGAGKINLPGPLAESFPEGSDVQVINEVSYSVNTDKRLLRKIDGVSNPVADGIVALSFAPLSVGVLVGVEAESETHPETIRRWSTWIGYTSVR